MHLSQYLASLAMTSLIACTVDFGQEHLDHSDQAITGGSPESGYPSVFALAYNGEGGCTGTCITPTVGLTAAHCVQGEPASVLSALFGNSEESPERTIAVIEVLAESSFDGSSRDADIALLRFAEACPNFVPYNPSALEGQENQPVTMVGFGVTTEDAGDAGIKRSGTATLFSVSPAAVGGMQEGELATSNEPHGTCNGDSGGPTFMVMDGTEYVIGVTSRGSTNASGNDEPCGQGKSIATRTDSYAEFIDAFIENDSGTGQPPGDGNDPSPDPMPTPDTSNDEPGPLVSGCQASGNSSPYGLATLLLTLALLAIARRTRAVRKPHKRHHLRSW